MIKVEGYKAFFGTMLISPVILPPFEITAAWLYKPDAKCWYGNGSSFIEDICKVVCEMPDPSIQDC